MSPSLWQILIVAALIVLFFGRGRISDMMGDLGRGITSFKRGLNESDEDSASKEAPRIEAQGSTVEASADKSADRSTTS